MQLEKPFYGDMKPFCIIYQNSCLLILSTTRPHNTWSSQRILFFEISNIYIYIFLNGKGDSHAGAWRKHFLCRRLTLLPHRHGGDPWADGLFPCLWWLSAHVALFLFELHVNDLDKKSSAQILAVDTLTFFRIGSGEKERRFIGCW
jgi:hypothetical protein